MFCGFSLCIALQTDAIICLISICICVTVLYIGFSYLHYCLLNTNIYKTTEQLCFRGGNRFTSIILTVITVMLNAEDTLL